MNEQIARAFQFVQAHPEVCGQISLGILSALAGIHIVVYSAKNGWTCLCWAKSKLAPKGSLLYQEIMRELNETAGYWTDNGAVVTPNVSVHPTRATIKVRYADGYVDVCELPPKEVRNIYAKASKMHAEHTALKNHLVNIETAHTLRKMRGK